MTFGGGLRVDRFSYDSAGFGGGGSTTDTDPFGWLGLLIAGPAMNTLLLAGAAARVR